MNGQLIAALLLSLAVVVLPSSARGADSISRRPRAGTSGGRAVAGRAASPRVSRLPPRSCCR